MATCPECDIEIQIDESDLEEMKKAGFIVGGEHGSGVMSCRHGNTWTAPVFMEMTKGSAGLQIGVQSIDLVLVVMNQR